MSQRHAVEQLLLCSRPGFPLDVSPASTGRAEPKNLATKKNARALEGLHDDFDRIYMNKLAVFSPKLLR